MAAARLEVEVLNQVVEGKTRHVPSEGAVVAFGIRDPE